MPVAVAGVTAAVKLIVVPKRTGDVLSAVRTVVVDVGLMLTVSGPPVEPANQASPEYTAVIECPPTVSAFVTSGETAPPLSGWLSSVVLPSLNATVPVGVLVLGDTGATVALSVTNWPTGAGLDDAVTVVVVPRAVTGNV